MAGDSMKGSGNCDDRKAGKHRLELWLNKSMRIKMTDGRTLIGTFLCTDCDCNIIMGSCEEYLKSPDSEPREDPRILGLAMIPGKHVVSIEIDESLPVDENESDCPTRNNSNETTSSGLDSSLLSESERSISKDSIVQEPS
ncbi:N-alpha-acetyltransferase 38, NatC auxiliary subunit-like [Physella acuta]|uniref:N-alpha-acetyltransferase 38, NatC auxiliary subunit-like n=1 Tax=Physella acuta TaxID=109671 RepID=UPI0027DD252B|nr:N-alpha-acetyltransferase 38, NatC auxiliary subunit-like [Physella acuta]